MIKCLHKGELIDGELLCVGCEQNLNKYVTEDDLLEIKKASLKEEVGSLQDRVDKCREFIGSFTLSEEDLKKSQDSLNDVLSLIGQKNEILSKLSNEALFLKANIIELNDETNKKNAEIDELKENVGLKSKQSLNLSTEVASLKEEKSSLEWVMSEKINQLSMLEDINKEVATSKNDLSSLKQEIESLNKTISDLENKVTLLKSDIADKEKGMAVREGDVSRRETWLANKEEALRLLKNELEEFYNRKFPYIIV